MSFGLTINIPSISVLVEYGDKLPHAFFLSMCHSQVPFGDITPSLVVRVILKWPGLLIVETSTHIKPKKKPSTSDEEEERKRREDLRKRQAREKEAADARKREEERQRRCQNNDGVRWNDPYGIPTESFPMGKGQPSVPIPWDFQLSLHIFMAH